MVLKLIVRFLWETDRKCLRKFMYNLVWKSIWTFRKFNKRRKKGELFPAFQFISVTDNCNLTCQGCWVTQGEKSTELSVDQVNNIIYDSKKTGSYFFGILGGEPLMNKPLFDIFNCHPDCYFQLFTNGTLLSEDVAKKLKMAGNVTPLISFEGDENVAYIRRGGTEVYKKTIKALEICQRNKLIAGVAISVCKSNLEMALSDEFIRMIWNRGASYLWYYIFRPGGSNPSFELALEREEIDRLRYFMVHARTRHPIILIDAYWGADGKPFCPAVEGLSHHIGPSGYIEPCPVIQLAKDSINGRDLNQVYQNSIFLREFKKEVAGLTNGCIFMENPGWLNAFASRYSAVNTSNRPDYNEDLKHAIKTISHGSSKQIPEKSRIYKFAKKKAFFGLGAYG